MKINTLLLCVTLGSLIHAAVSSKIAQPRSAASTADCQVCLYAMKFIRYLTLRQDLPLSAVREKFNALYQILPSNVKNEEFLRNLDVYVSMVKEGKDPRTICTLFLRKCATNSLERPKITECEVCTAVIDLVKFELIISNATVQVIIKAVEALCAILGDVPVYEECKLILEELDKIIQWVEEEITPTDICIRLGMCPNNTLMAKAKNVKTATCHIVVHNLKTQYRKGWSQDKMKEKITTICSKLGLNRFHCYRIQTNLKTILALIKKGQGAEEVCGDRIKPNNHVSLMNDQPTNYCDFCMMLMEVVSTQLGQLDDGLKQIETKLNQLCSHLEDLSDECKYVVGLVVADIERNVQYTESFLKPSESCKKLKLCPKSLEF